MAVVAVSVFVACGDGSSGTGPPTNRNRAPERLSPIPDQALMLAGGAATLDMVNHFTDPDGDALTYAVGSSDDSVAAATASGSVVTVRPVGPGTASVTVIARDAGGLETSWTFTATVQAGPDLVVSMVRDSFAVAPGSSFRFSTTIRNLGDADAVATRLRTFESADTVITTSDDEIGEPTDVPALGPGESARGTVTVSVSGSASPRTLHLGQCVDAVQGEFYTGNNCSKVLRVVIRAADGTTADSVAQAGSPRPDSVSGHVLRIEPFSLRLSKDGGHL